MPLLIEQQPLLTLHFQLGDLTLKLGQRILSNKTGDFSLAAAIPLLLLCARRLASLFKLPAQIFGEACSMVGKKSYKLKSLSKSVPSDKSKNLKLKAKQRKDAKKIAKALKQGKKAKAKLTDEVGNRKSQKLKVKLKR